MALRVNPAFFAFRTRIPSSLARYNAPDELPMRPAAGQIGTGFGSASAPHFHFQQKP
jgi:hypothetical protein